MDLRRKFVLFRLTWRGRRELRGIDLFEKPTLAARVVDQDQTGVWIRSAEGEPGVAVAAGPAELLKWEFIATATVDYQEELDIAEPT